MFLHNFTYICTRIITYIFYVHFLRRFLRKKLLKKVRNTLQPHHLERALLQDTSLR